MSKKVVFIHASPRKHGNTRALAGAAGAALAEEGVACDWIDAAWLDFKHPGCLACYKCQQSDAFGCHVDDGLARAVASLPDYDALVLASPLYWFSYPAQVKMLIDRMFSLIKFTETHEIITPLKGKPLALLATAGGAMEENLEMLETLWRIPAKRVGSPFLSCLFPMCHYQPGEAVNDPVLAAKARDFGKKLAGMLTA
jgi:multimeric flavodoxin WrbA